MYYYHQMLYIEHVDDIWNTIQPILSDMFNYYTTYKNRLNRQDTLSHRVNDFEDIIYWFSSYKDIITDNHITWNKDDFMKRFKDLTDELIELNYTQEDIIRQVLITALLKLRD